MTATRRGSGKAHFAWWAARLLLPFLLGLDLDMKESKRKERTGECGGEILEESAVREIDGSREDKVAVGHTHRNRAF